MNLEDCIDRIRLHIEDEKSKHELNMAMKGLYGHPFDFPRLGMIKHKGIKDCSQCGHYRFVGGDGYCTNQGMLFEMVMIKDTPSNIEVSPQYDLFDGFDEGVLAELLKWGRYD